MTIKRPYSPKWNLNLNEYVPAMPGWGIPGYMRKPTFRAAGRVGMEAYASAYPDPVPGAFSEVIGINTHTFFDIQRWWPFLALHGVYWVRINLSWNRFEPITRGEYDWAYFDSVFTVASRNNIRILGILDGNPPWSAALARDAYAQAYADAATLAAARYGTTGTFWKEHPELTPKPLAAVEIMNEPYHNPLWSMNVSAYSLAARRALSAVKATDPAISVGIPVEYGSYWMPGITAYDQTVWRDCDFLSAHPYLSFSGGVNGPRDMSQAVQKCFWRLGPMHDWTPSQYPRKPIWVTEFGFTNASGVTAHVDKATSALWLKDALDLAFRHFRFVERFFYYDLSVSTGDMNNQEGNFGLLEPDGTTLKPAWYELIRYAG